jgi:hypothetical protein
MIIISAPAIFFVFAERSPAAAHQHQHAPPTITVFFTTLTAALAPAAPAEDIVFSPDFGEPG